MANLSDFLLLGGVALCVISVIAAIIQIMQTVAPRGAVITLVLGIVLIFAAAYTGPRPFTVSSVCDAWQRVIGGEPASSEDADAAGPADGTGESTDAGSDSSVEAEQEGGTVEGVSTEPSN